MTRVAMKPQNVYDKRNNDELEIEWETKILIFTLNHSSIDMWRWIFVQSMRS
jgi:hypothetical protein